MKLKTLSLHSIAIISLVTLTGCGSTAPKVAVDPTGIQNLAKFEKDKAMCTDVAMSYDLSSETAVDATTGALIGGAAVAGIATIVAGAIFLPALPFIAAGTAAGGYLGGSGSDDYEKRSRERILRECLTNKGYKVY
jgi:hypothetical protein